MPDSIADALRGLRLACACMTPKKCPDGFPDIESVNFDERAVSVMREYAAICRGCLDVGEMPIEDAPSIAYAAGFYEGVLLIHDWGISPSSDNLGQKGVEGHG